MGMTVSVFRWGLGDCTNGGVSAVAGSLCVVNVPGPFNPSPALPAVELVEGPGGRGHAILRVEAKKPGIGAYVPETSLPRPFLTSTLGRKQPTTI
jgi:hypothetical protein